MGTGVVRIIIGGALAGVNVVVRQARCVLSLAWRLIQEEKEGVYEHTS
jgi:hypothetical protein